MATVDHAQGKALGGTGQGSKFEDTCTRTESRPGRLQMDDSLSENGHAYDNRKLQNRACTSDTRSYLANGLSHNSIHGADSGNEPTMNFHSVEAQSFSINVNRLEENMVGAPKTRITAAVSEPDLPIHALGTRQQHQAHPFRLSKSELHDNKIEKALAMEDGPANLDDGGVLHATQSMPVWMPSVVSSTITERADEEPLKIVNKGPLLQAPECGTVDSHHSNKDSTTAEVPLARTKSMPSNSSPSADEGHLPRSNTEKRRSKKNLDNANLRVVADAKLSNRQKKKLMRKLATVQTDGAVEFDVGRSARLAKDLFGSNILEQGNNVPVMEEDDEFAQQQIPPLTIVMLIVGTRGDVQPFIAIGKRLQEYGHQVRLASHANFREFVKREGLEFYPLGGDPKVLAGYMVKNKGFLPSGPSEISIQRKQIKSIVHSLLPACTEPDDSGVPFRAQAIIANPPAYGHVHVAEYLKVPLHIFFTMPWTPTNAFPHPLARVKNSAGNRLSYQVVDSLIWFGIRGIINDYRKKKLKLRPITYLSGSQGSISELPTGYIWSPHLVPKPRDWGPLIDVVGFCFLNLASDYKPPDDLLKWLQAGKPPIYIGFGSLPVEDPDGMTKIIIETLKRTQQRGIIGKGWGGIGNLSETPDFVYLINDCPHDWLFPQCAAVVHHGGAGTTAAGLKAACPTTIVPFFGDQPFWGDRVHEKAVGPVPIPVSHFSLEKLVHAFKYMLDPEVKKRATELAKAMETENGIEGAVSAFHKHIQKHLPELMRDKFPESPQPSAVRKTLIKFGRSSCWTFKTS